MSTIIDLNLGAAANDDTGTKLRAGGQIINDNFDNLNDDKAEISGQVFTGAIAASNLSGTNTGDQDLSGLLDKATYDPQTIGGDAFDTDNHTDGTVNQVFPLNRKKGYDSIASTTLLTGCVVTIASATTVDISSGTGVHVDNHTDPLNPVYTPVTYAGVTGLTPAHTATGSTYFSIDSAGLLVEDAALPTRSQLRDAFVVGDAISFDGVNLAQADNFAIAPSLNTALNLDDFIEGIGGLINPEGNTYSVGTTNTLGFNKGAGRVFWFGANFKNGSSGRKDPNNLTTGALVDLSFIYTWQDGVGGFNLGTLITSVVPADYDDGTGGASAPNGSVGNNQFVNHRIYYDATTDLTLVQFGQNKYGNMDTAVGAAQTETFIKNPLLNGTMFRGWVTIKGNATDIGNTSQGVFTPGGVFQDIGGGSLSSIPGTTQSVYNNSINPELITNATLGAFTIRRGSALDTDNIYEGENGAGTITFSVDGDGVIDSTVINTDKGADIASATTTDIGAATGNFVDITGTTTITGFGTVQAGVQRTLQFDGILILTHNGTSLILPTGANITTAAGDTCDMISLGSGNWVCTNYQRADGTALVGGAGNKTVFLMASAGQNDGSVSFAGNSPCVVFADGVADNVRLGWTVPDGGATIVSVKWHGSSNATSGDAYLVFKSQATADGVSMNTGSTTDIYNPNGVTTNATAQGLEIIDITTAMDGLTLTAGYNIGIRIERQGQIGADTLGASHLGYGVEIVYS